MASGQPQEIDIQNEQSLNTLVRAITLAQNQFALILVRCNYAQLRDRITIHLQERCPFPVHTLTLPESAKTLYTTIQTEIKGWSDEGMNQWSDEEIPSVSSPTPTSPT
ncbi:MAG: hypothetical protein HC866_23975, partial [Leptolyngbyaceae cyanobacterium RU_5_1]|nr:hypothetical protein [Leptolyngbyaceae cyanobacterium RU_5_1]